MSNTTQGRRVYLRPDPLPNEIPCSEPGDYGLGADGVWYGYIPKPGFGLGNFSNHMVTEHEDGTITVYPSILTNRGDDRVWHGYLERGVWREV